MPQIWRARLRTTTALTSFAPCMLAVIVGGAGLAAGMPSAWAQSGPVNYGFRGADGGCCSDSNGHDGAPGQRDFIQTDQNLYIRSTASGVAGILVDVSGGRGGDGNPDDYRNHWGGNGGAGRNVDYTLQDSTITSTAVGINIYSNGGNGGLWGNAGGPNGGYGIGGSGGNLARLTLNNTTVSAFGFGVAVQSWGGSGTDSALAGGFGGERDAGSGGNSADTTVTLRGSTTITVKGPGPGDVNAGVGLISLGGNGGAGERTGDFGGHVYAGSAGNAGNVTFLSEAASKIVTSGDGVHGVSARSIGGDASTNNSTDTRAGAGGNGGAVTINSAGTITTSGNRAIGILALSEGGQGGNGGDGSWGNGHRGAPGGTPGAININNFGTISTGGTGTVGAYGILAQTLGGAGGPGGDGGGFGSGGSGGTGGGSPAVTISNRGKIQTAGNDAAGIIAYSIGGGGGNGGVTNGLFYTVGGSGGGGGNGGDTTLNNTGLISTSGDHSPGAILQSIGGGGGVGGDASTTGVIASIAIGGQGGGGGPAGNIPGASSSGSITTTGASSPGVLLQSIGGGGGHAGSANAVGVGIGLNVTLATGGKGGAGGGGGIIQFANEQHGAITTSGPLSTGILAQSIGGGGGAGGFANSKAITIAPPTGDNPSGTVSIAVTHGGSGGTGGNAATPDIANAGSIATSGAMSNGITAQSIGGGGGNGGGVLAPMKIPTVGPSNLNIGVTVRTGGSGGAGGEGSWVRVTNNASATITTKDAGSIGILAQSIGGGGGNGGNVQQHDANSFNNIVGSPTAFLGAAKTVAQYLEKVPDTLKWDKKINASVAVTLGGSGGTGGDADKFIIRNDGVITTQGNHASGIVAQSIGGGGGNAGAIDSSAASSLLSSIDGLAQAIAKGAGNLFTLGLPALNPTVQIGGSGGSFGAGGGSDPDPSIVTNTGKISTQGVASAGIVAQSIGGGGGNSMVDAQSVEDVIKKAAGAQAPEIIGWVTQIVNLFGTKGGSVISDKLNVRVGGSGFDGSLGAHGGSVVVDASAFTSDIRTQGAQAPGILAQSVGGGGGVSASNHALVSPGSTGSQVSMGTSAFLRLSNAFPPMSGGNVSVTNGGSIATQGIDSAGILAQSIGGGGGVSTVNMLGTGTVVSAQSAAHSLTLGGEFAAYTDGFSAVPASAGGNVTVANTGQIVTAGTLSHAILAQSIGGGGGTAVVSTNAGTTTIDATLGVRPRTDITVNQGVIGSGGTVTVSSSGSIVTASDLAFGVLAQSVGGGGGYLAADSGSAATSAPMKLTFGANGGNGGAGGTVNATLEAGGKIVTQGTNAYAILAQSIGGGGGVAGLTTRPGLVTPQGVASPHAIIGGGNDGGAVNVTIAGDARTMMPGAIGVMAQSIGGGGGIAGDTSAAQYGAGMIGNAGLTSSTGNGGAVTVNVNSGGSVQTFGNNTPAIYAMSIGGGAVIKDGAYYQYNTLDGFLTYGGPVTVNVHGNATVAAHGANSPAIVVFSNGSYGGSGGVWVNIDKNASVLANMDSGTGILAPMGITVNNDGFIQAKTAISAAQAVVVNNNGTIQGDVILTGNGTFNNNAGGALWSGATVQTTTFNNAGTLNPGGPGNFQNTHIVGVLRQMTGIYAPDLDFAAHNSDFITVSGASTFGGTLTPVLHNPVKGEWLGIAHFDVSQTSIPTARSSSPLFSYELRNNGGGSDWQDPLVSVDADFKTSALPVSSDRQNIANHLQSLWDLADKRSATLFDRFTGVATTAQYQAALDGIAHDGKFARSANQIHESYAAMNRMMSCPAFVGGGTLLRESDCSWGRINTNWVDRGGTTNDNGYRIRQTTLQVGTQREVHPDWFVGASLSYGFGNTSSSPGIAATNDTFSGGMAVKYNRGPWQLAAAIHGGFEATDMRRQTFGATATSRPASVFVAGRLRAAYEFDEKTWYARPYVDLDVNHVRMFGYSEQNANVFNLQVLGNSTTAFMISPMVEIGGRTTLAEGTLRSYMAMGASFLSGGDVTTSMRLSEFNLTPFSVTTGAPTLYGNLSAGLELVTMKGIEVKAEYGLRAASHYVDQSLAIRAAYRF